MVPVCRLRNCWSRCGTTVDLNALVGVGKVTIVDDASLATAFTGFVRANERRLRHALIAGFGGDLGREAASEALTYAWENWERVHGMENPVGYLYTVGRNWALRSRTEASPPLRLVGRDVEPHVEPGLAAALAALSARQRAVVVMVHCFDWSLAETADVLGLAKTTIQNHLERGMAALRRELGET
jgi:DNA-directed RNA polymerase specialized sigma24 family protein